VTALSKSPARGETVFVSANLAGRVIITPAAAHIRGLRRLGLHPDHVTSALPGSEELDSNGRLALPSDVAVFLARGKPAENARDAQAVNLHVGFCGAYDSSAAPQSGRSDARVERDRAQVPPCI